MKNRTGARFLASFVRNLAAGVPKGAAFPILVALIFSALFSFATEKPQDLLAAGRVDQAIEILEQQIHSSPTGEAYNFLCRAHFELGVWDAGIPFCEKAVALAPDVGLYHLWLGRIYGEKADRAGFLSAAGLAKKVRTEFERAVELTPNSWEARTDLAEFYVEAPGLVGGGKDRARAQADLLVPLDSAMAHWVKARVAEKSKDITTAEREYRAAIDASHGGARAWLNLAGFYRHRNRLDEMDQALRTLESSPLDHPAALVDGASILVRSGRDSSLAIRLLRRYLDSSVTVEEAPAFRAHYMLGEIFEKQGERNAAAEQYRAALSMAHSFRPAQDGLKRVTS
jgi:tetratricopeptide (TPR) repeat protein